MLQLLLDEHISPRVAHGLRSKLPEITIYSLVEWEGSKLCGMPDPTVLTEASKNGLTLVTFDLATIAPLLKSWGESGHEHGGVIFVDERSIAPNNFGGLIRALAQLWKVSQTLPWTNRVLFLKLPRG